MNETKENLLPWIGVVARLALGGVLLVAGAIKIPYPYKAAAAMRAYELLPNSFASFFGYILPWFEVGLGLLLILGVATRLSALLCGLLMLLFIGAISSAWARGLTIDCGCFGGGGQVAAGETRYLQEIIRDIALAVTALYLYFQPHSRFALDNRGK
ncbi:MAG: DoxX family membrane protein [Actinobacteria bacterium]|uniref:Methylamine utilization protein MauE n=1 Tax=Candidatus Fonsibacter lacus TaxID=2576439 RepID=A0A965GCR0_9PROT|nr:DoxX family membrane protein [Candidatus Fonsibacter lacus]